ncbi:hypothetical protein ACA910_015726 [Epithemia clementina (nom. ined.)]
MQFDCMRSKGSIARSRPNPISSRHAIASSLTAKGGGGEGCATGATAMNLPPQLLMQRIQFDNKVHEVNDTSPFTMQRLRRSSKNKHNNT